MTSPMRSQRIANPMIYSIRRMPCAANHALTKLVIGHSVMVSTNRKRYIC